MAERDVSDVWGAEKGFGAARGSASFAWQVVCKVFDKWERCSSQVSRDMNAKGHAVWRVYRAADWCVYEGYEGARVLYLCQACVSEVVWDAVIARGKVPRRGGVSWRERNVKVGQAQERHQLVKDQRSRSAIIHVDVMLHHYGRRMWSICGHLVKWWGVRAVYRYCDIQVQQLSSGGFSRLL